METSKNKKYAQRCKRMEKKLPKVFIIISLLWQMAGQISIFVFMAESSSRRRRDMNASSLISQKKLGIWFITADNQTKPIGFYEPTVKPQTAVASSFMTDLILLLLAADHITFILVSASAMSSNYLVILLHSVMRQLIFYSYTHSHRLISTAKI